MTAHHDLDRQLNDFLGDGPTELPYPSFDAVRDRIDQTGQLVVLGPWRFPDMNRIVTFGLGAAALILAVFLGAQVLGSPGTNVGGEPTPTATASATPDPTPEPTPAATPWSGLSEGRFAMAGADGGTFDGSVQISIDIGSPGWRSEPTVDFVYKNDDGLDAPQTVGGALIGWSWPAGTEFLVYGDPCRWASTIPEPATTPEEIATAFRAQAQTDATEPVDVTVGGYAGKAVTLTVPMSYEVPGATREEEFGDCDEDQFTFYGIVGEDSAVARNAQGPGQIDELWILDVNGSIVILDAVYGPATPPDLVDELRTLAESATFGD